VKIVVPSAGSLLSGVNDVWLMLFNPCECRSPFCVPFDIIADRRGENHR